MAKRFSVAYVNTRCCAWRWQRDGTKVLCMKKGKPKLCFVTQAHVGTSLSPIEVFGPTKDIILCNEHAEVGWRP